MKAKKLHLVHFRSAKDLSIDLEPGLNLLVGANGAGKSTILDSLAILLSWASARLRSANASGRRILNIDINNEKNFSWLELSCQLEAETEAEISWRLAQTRMGRNPKMDASDPTHGLTHLIELNEWANGVREQIGRSNAQVNVPLFVYYPVNRSVLDIPLRIKKTHSFGILDAYDSAFTGGANFRDFFEWFRTLEDIENEFYRENSGYEDPHLRAIRKAISAFLPGFSQISVKRSPLRMEVTKNGEKYRIDQMSDGEKCLFALVGDLGWGYLFWMKGYVMRRYLLPLCLAVGSLMLSGCISLAGLGLGQDRGKVSIERIQKAEKLFVMDEILMIPLSGLVAEGNMKERRGEPGMLVALKDRLDAAKDNPRIKAVILRIDSPGGSVTAADLIYREIVRFKEKKKIPVIALMSGTAASGGVYIAMAADEIYALPTTVTGSIGVITMLPSLKGLSDKIGFQMRVIKSGANKDLGSPWRDLSSDEQKIFQDLIDSYFVRFKQIILDSRKEKGLTEEKLKALADGRVFTPDVAKANGLIDGIMYPDEVIEHAKQVAQVRDAHVISYEYPMNYRGHIYAESDIPAPEAQSGIDINLLKLDLNNFAQSAHGAQFLYLWMP